MPLSEQEQRLLDEMERSLYHGDADFVASVGRVRTGVNYTAVVGGVLLGLAGVAVLLLGVVLQAWIVGVVGFAVMFAGVLGAVGHPRRRMPRALRRRGALLDRLTARWDRRRRA
jgi:hypothetical protein